MDENIVRLLWHIVKKFEDTGSYSKDDLFQEARIAATIALAEYDVNKKTKISTYIYSHVYGHLKNLRRSYISERKREKDYSEVFTLLDSFNEIEFVEFILTMKKILNEKEYAVFVLHFAKGFTVEETAKLLKTAKMGVVACSRVIRHKLRLLEKNLHQNLTQTRLQSSWLEDSPSLPKE